MSSDTPAILDTSQINGGKILFRKDFVKEITGKNSTIPFENYRTWDAKFRATGKLYIKRYIKTSTVPESVSLESMTIEWEKLSTACLDSPEMEEYMKLEPAFDNLMTFDILHATILILGLGSPSLKSDNFRSLRQLRFIQAVIHNHVNRLWLNWDFVEGQIPRVFIDTTLLNPTDLEFIEKEIPRPEAWKLCLYALGRLTSLFDPKYMASLFIITFDSDNPVRQILADWVEPLDPTDPDIPAAIICAPSHVSNPPSDALLYAGDDTSDRVQKFLDLYQQHGFTSQRWEAEGVPFFGKISMHIDKRLCDGLPSPLNCPGENPQSQDVDLEQGHRASFDLPAPSES